jgi:Domain of unknown function (DUF4055)
VVILEDTIMSESSKRVDNRSAAYDAMYEARIKVRTVLAGTDSMRRAGKKFLPQFQHESDQHYTHRLSSSNLVNVAILTLNDWVGRPFSKPVTFDESTPQGIQDLSDDVDLQGTDVGTFLRKSFRTSISQGTANILVEYPTVEDKPNRTLQNDLQDNLRPYWVHVEPLDVIFAYSELVNNKETLTHLRLYEENIVLDGFSEVLIKNIRVYDLTLDGLVMLTVYQEDPEESEDSDDRWFISKPARVIDSPEIPFKTFYCSRQGLMVSDIPLEGLVDLNIEHWQIKSEIRRNVSVANFPILSHKGGTLASNEPIQFGPMSLLNSPSGEFFYLEHQGTAIASGMTYLESVEDSMGLYGAEFLRARPGTITVQKTATQSAIEHAATISPLQDITLRFKDWVETVLDLTAYWFGLGDIPGVGGTVTMATDFTELNLEKGLEWLTKARELRDLSQENYLEALQRRGILLENFDYEANNEQLASEPIFGGYNEAEIDQIESEARRQALRNAANGTTAQ